MHLGLDPVGSLHGRDHSVHVLLKDRLLDCQIESLLLEPPRMSLRPSGLALIDPTMTQQEGPQTLPGLEFDRLHVLACSGQIAHRFLIRTRHPRPA